MPTALTPADEIHRTLHAAGWSTGVDAMHTTGGEFHWIAVNGWSTIGHRGELCGYLGSACAR
jgi:hypothetical protein